MANGTRGRPKGIAKPPGSGKQKGTPNKTSRSLIAQLDELGMSEGIDHPVVWMYKVAHGLIAFDVFNGEEIVKIPADANQRITCMKEVAKYVSPQLKAIDHTGNVGVAVTYLDPIDKDI
ncbi:MAG: hypothetical protein WC901_00780 [Candidatus Margulisiibacteriota bacterium]